MLGLPAFAGSVVANVEFEFEVDPPRFFQSTYEAPMAAASTIMMIAKGRYFFMMLRMHCDVRHLTAIAAFGRGRNAQRLWPLNRRN